MSENVIFKNTKTGKTDQYTASEIKSVQWVQRARGYGLRITLINSTVHIIDGFRESVSETVHKGFVSEL